MHLLDVGSMHWSQPITQGDMGHPRSSAAACVIPMRFVTEPPEVELSRACPEASQSSPARAQACQATVPFLLPSNVTVDGRITSAGPESSRLMHFCSDRRVISLLFSAALWTCSKGPSLWRTRMVSPSLVSWSLEQGFLTACPSCSRLLCASFDEEVWFLAKG